MVGNQQNNDFIPIFDKEWLALETRKNELEIEVKSLKDKV
jgi:hypothetical protein